MSQNGDSVSQERAGTNNSDHKAQGIPETRNALDSKSASYIGTQHKQDPASRSGTNMDVSTQEMGTPSCTYRGRWKTGKYEVAQADRVNVQRGRPLQKSHSEKLPRRREGRGVTGVTGTSTPNHVTRGRTQSDKRPRNDSESLV